MKACLISTSEPTAVTFWGEKGQIYFEHSTNMEGSTFHIVRRWVWEHLFVQRSAWTFLCACGNGPASVAQALMPLSCKKTAMNPAGAEDELW